MADKKLRSVAKTFSWRLIIFIYWVIFGYIYTGTFSGAGILGVGSIIPLLFYYFHERIWDKVKWGLDYILLIFEFFPSSSSILISWL